MTERQGGDRRDSDDTRLGRLKRTGFRLICSPYGAVLLGAFVLGITLLSWHWLEQRHRKIVAADCERLAREYSSALSDNATLLLTTVRALEAYWAGSERVEDDEFRVFSQPLLRNGSSIHALQWISRVPGEERADFTERARKVVRSDYEIVEMDRDGGLKSAAERDEHLAVTYLESADISEVAHGFDWASVPEIRDSLSRARDRAAPVMAPAYDLPGDTVDKPRVIIFSPV
ncbi:MAG: CHASE domain-containing protein, partial [Persicimonas sp.]